MLVLSSREANQNFAKVIRAAAAGEEVLITRRGVPVAKVVPVPPATEAAAERAAAIKRMLARAHRGFDLGGNAWPGRQTLYDEILGTKPCDE
jgi:prevent-host-death family protein